MTSKNGHSKANGAALIPVGGYIIRMSSDKQEDSPERQWAEINTLAERDGFRIVAWYEDHAKTGTKSANRSDFQRLLKDAGLGIFKRVLVHEQSRFSREKLLKVFGHLSILDDFGVFLATTRRGRINFNDIGDMVTTLVEAHSAREESIKIADRFVGGSRMKAERGDRSDVPLFGFDRELTDESGEVIKRVHFREKFTKPKTWRVGFVVSSDTVDVDAIRWAFERIASGSSSVGDVLREFRRRGLKTTKGNVFGCDGIRRMLRNRAYCGDAIAGLYCRGQFRRVDERGPIVREDAHEPIVGRQVFLDVQRTLTTFDRQFTKPIAAAHILSKLVECGHCGRTMYGMTCQRGDGRNGHRGYCCQRRKKEVEALCSVRPSLNAAHLEDFIIRAVDDYVLIDRRVQRLAGAMDSRQARLTQANRRSTIESQVADLLQKIDRTETNLALAATAADFAAISKLLAEWRGQLAGLEAELGQIEVAKKVRPAAIETLRRLLPLRARWRPEHRADIANALRLTIKRIRIWRRWTHTGLQGHSKCNALYGEIEFHDGVCDDSPKLRFTDLDIDPHPRMWRRVCAFVRSAPDQPVMMHQIMKQFPGADRGNLRTILLAGVAEGLCIKSRMQSQLIATALIAKHNLLWCNRTFYAKPLQRVRS